ncbi:hypothetical protein OIV83_005613 [Microbotryomycetes sp. JL201]|nr:hypothetical protein OIV83_005613 [Microbotryomycetes sp. JL201]
MSWRDAPPLGDWRRGGGDYPPPQRPYEYVEDYGKPHRGERYGGRGSRSEEYWHGGRADGADDDWNSRPKRARYGEGSDYGYDPRAAGSGISGMHDDYTRRHDTQQYNYPPRQQQYGDNYDDRDWPGDRSSRRDRTAPAPVVSREPPSASVVFLGLPAHVNDQILREFLEDMGAAIDSTTVIFDRQTNTSKRYGFAKFISVEHARAFVEPNFPAVTWKERNGAGDDDSLKIKINYSQKMGGWREDQGATARLSEDQRKGQAASSAPQTFYHNDGTRDIGSMPSQILLLRNLDPLTTEAEIVTALCSLGDPVGSQIRTGGIKKVILIRDRASRASWGYAFVQFSDVKLASGVLGSAFNSKIYPEGFRISNAVVAFSFSHENSFTPVYAKSEWSFQGEGKQQLAYWDDRGYASIYVPPAAAAARAKAESADADMDAFFSSLEAEMDPEALGERPNANESGPPTMAGMGPIKLKGAPGPSSKIGSSARKGQGSDAGGENDSIQSRAASTSTATAASAPVPAAASTIPLLEDGKKKSGDLIYSRKKAADISKWNTKQAELKQPDLTKPASSGPVASTSVNAIPVRTSSGPPSHAVAPTSTASSSASAPAQAAQASSTSSAKAEDEFEYGDAVSMICLLCQRQFKSIDDLRRHNNLSALHKSNLANPKAVSTGAARKAAAVAKRKTAQASTSDEHSTDVAQALPKYVDRAAQRREALGQSDHPGMTDSKKRKFDGPAPPSQPSSVPKKTTEAIEESNVGSKMLAKMGWSKGTGLGASGAGVVDPITASQFAQGVGLGASKGVAVGTVDAGPKGYAEQLRDKARARFEDASSK